MESGYITFEQKFRACFTLQLKHFNFVIVNTLCNFVTLAELLNNSDAFLFLICEVARLIELMHSRRKIKLLTFKISQKICTATVTGNNDYVCIYIYIYIQYMNISYVYNMSKL